VPALGTVAPVNASAATCHSQGTWVKNPATRILMYKVKVVCPAGATSGTPSTGGNSAPSCDIKTAPPATFCWGSKPCYYKASVVPYLPPAKPAPTPGAAYRVLMCLTSGAPGGSAWLGTAQWVGQALQPPPLIDQAVEAFGLLKAPSATLVFNPTARTLVNLETWFWADGLTRKELRGSPAFGLVAVATPARLEVTPGDGSAQRPCPWVISKSDRCSYPYWRSSNSGPARGPNGAPAYEASAHAVWTVRFERIGAPVVIAGAPDELTGPEMTAPVVVVEVQTIVTGTG